MFSIVMPLWNGRDTVASSIASALAQSYADFELIVVDDGSTDGSLEVVAAFDDPRIRILGQANAGPGAARDAGMAVARADWIAFLDSDDLWLPDHLAELDRLRTRFPEAGLIGTAFVWRRPDGLTRRPRPGPERLELINFFERIATQENLFWISSAAVPKSTLAAIGGFAEPGRSRIGSEDMLYWLRISLALPVAVSSRCTAVYRQGPGGLSMVTRNRWQGRPLHMPADVSARVAFLLDHRHRAPAALRPGIDAFVDGEFRWCLRSSARIGDLDTIRALRPLYLRPPRAWDRLLLAAARLPDPAARFACGAAAAIVPRLLRLGRRLRG